MYRPPSSPPENCRLLLDLLDDLPPNSLLLGDFNYPYINWRDSTAVARGKDFLEKCNEACLEQLVMFPTHTKGNILDLVLSNNPEIFLSVSSKGRLGKSDHDMLLVELDTPRRPEQTQAVRPIWDRADWVGMKREWSNIDWRSTLAPMSTEEAWQHIKSKLNQSEKNYVPCRTWKTSRRPP